MKQNELIERFLERPPELEGGVDLRIEPLGEGEARLVLRHGSSRAQLRAAPLSVPFPSGLRRLLAAHDGIEAVLVEQIPSGLDAAAQEAGVSYLDLQGRGRLVAPGFVYVVAPRIPSRLESAPRKPRVSPFAPKASRIVRALLSDPKNSYNLSDLVHEVDLDPGNAHRVLGALIEAQLVERDKNNYRVVDPGSLLEAWAESAVRVKDRVSLHLEGEPADLAQGAMELVGGAGVVSGELAAELLAPHLPASGAIVHLPDRAAWSAARDALEQRQQPFPGSSRVQLVIDRPDPGVAQFGSEVNGLPIVSPAQLYVDMYRARGRARAAAEEMRRQVLGY